MGKQNDVFVWLGEASRVFEPSADRSMISTASANRRVNMNQRVRLYLVCLVLDTPKTHVGVFATALADAGRVRNGAC